MEKLCFFVPGLQTCPRPFSIQRLETNLAVQVLF